MRILFLLLGFLIVSCQKNNGQDKANSPFAAGERLAELTGEQLLEPSGLAASVKNPEMLWTHNDSGNGAEVFLIDRKLNIRMVCVLRGVRNRDWEDIAVGPGPKAGKTYVYVGEIGDNMAQYPFKHIYRFEEPVFKNGETKILIKDVDVLTFSLPDGKKDTESLMVHPVTGALYIVSKREEPVVVYTLKGGFVSGDTLTAEPVARLPHTQIVAADFSPDGKAILMKTYKEVLFWNADENKPVGETLKTAATKVNYTEEPQGESIAFARDGSGFFTISEQVKGAKSYLYFYPRK